MALCEDGFSAFPVETIYVPKLGVNFLSAKQPCKNELEGSFDKDRIFISDSNKIVISAKRGHELYIVYHISSQYYRKVLVATQDLGFPFSSEGINDCNNIDDKIISSQSYDSGCEIAKTKAEHHIYRVMSNISVILIQDKWENCVKFRYFYIKCNFHLASPGFANFVWQAILGIVSKNHWRNKRPKLLN